MIAVHVGAGNHSLTLRPQYVMLLKKACVKASKILESGSSSLEAVALAISILENSSITNAGFGSSLTFNGEVECDASIMEGSSCLYGAVGAVKRVKNPIILAESILNEQRKPKLGGLVAPSFLVGDGAYEWAKNHGVQTCNSKSLISKKSKEIHKKSVEYLNSLQNEQFTITSRSYGSHLRKKDDARERETCELPNDESRKPSLNTKQLKRKRSQFKTQDIKQNSSLNKNKEIIISSNINSFEKDEDNNQPKLKFSYSSSLSETQLVILQFKPSVPSSTVEISRHINNSSSTHSIEPIQDKDESILTSSQQSSGILKAIQSQSDLIRQEKTDSLEFIQNRPKPVSQQNSSKVKKNRKSISSQQNSNDLMLKHFEELLDTVGCLAVDCSGNVSAGVSSGGLLLKHSGRVGQAAHCGVGCWGQNNFDGGSENIAVSTTGCGEHLIKTQFGQLIAESTAQTDLIGQKLASDIQEKFIDSPLLRNVEKPMGGSLSLRHAEGVTDLFWTHTTPSMGIGFMKIGQKPKAFFSDLPEDKVGKTVVVNGKSFTHN